MPKAEKIRLFFIGFAAASAIAAAVSAGSARAQTGPDPQARQNPGLTVPDSAGRSGQAGQATRRLPADPGSSIEGDDDTIPRNDPTRDPIDPFEDGEAAQNRGLRPAVVDGSFEATEPSQPVDGVLDTPPDAAPQDGVDPVLNDLREVEDRDLFALTPSTEAPAGYDPQQFQIEDLEQPRRGTDLRREQRIDRRVQGLFEDDGAYEPIGYRIGSFLYFPESEITGVATDNVLRSSLIDSGDTYIELNTNTRLVSNWNRHSLEFRSRGLANFHNNFPSEDDAAYELEALGRLDIGKRTNLQGSISHDVRQEGRGAIDAATSGDRPDVTTDEARATFTHRFNRLSVELRGSATDQEFSPVTTLGVTTPNNERNSAITTEAVRASWEFKPTFSVFAEVELDQREFEAAPAGDNILRNSDGTYTRVGVDFGTTSQTLRGEISLGTGTQSPDDPRLASTSAFLVDGNLAWRISDLTSLLLTAQTDIFDTTTANSAFATSHTGGIELRHKFREYLIGTAGFTHTARSFEGSPVKESEDRTLLGLEYFVNREITLFGRYQYINFESNEINGGYDANDVRMGVRVRH